MASPFVLYPDAKSMVVASLWGLPHNVPGFKLTKTLEIIPTNPELDAIYHPRIKNPLPYGHYIIGTEQDKRYCMIHRPLDTADDALSSVTLAHQALCICYCFPYRIGPVFGFNSEGAPIPMVLSSPAISDANWELSHEVFFPTNAPSYYFNTPKGLFNPNDVIDFFKDLAVSYIETKDLRWILAANKFTSGIVRRSAYEMVLDFAIAIEALLNRGDQVGFSVRLFMALLIGKNLREREQIQADVKHFYGIRSKLIHGTFHGFNERELDLIKRIGDYLSRALKVTCRRHIEGDVFDELDFMSLLGAPRHSVEKVLFILSEKQIAEFISTKELGFPCNNYRAFLSEPDGDDDQYLMFEFLDEDNRYGPYEADEYFWLMPQMSRLSRYSYWISRNNDGQFTVLVRTIEP
jgi:hypothetical protein